MSLQKEFMNTAKSHVSLAREIWPRLIVVAEIRGIITRKTLAKRFGITGHALKHFDQIVATLESYCRQHALPALHTLIVEKDADVSGSAAEEVEKVYSYRWRERSPVIPSEADLSAARETVL